MYKSLENAIRGVFTEEKADMGDVQDLLRKTLEKEGGAAGLGALEKAVKDHKGVNVKDVLSKMSDVALHKHGDYYLKEAASGDCECTTEECDCNEPICVTCGKERDVVGEALATSDDHIIMQLRKAQDVRGNKEIKFRRGSAKVDPRHIDKILKLHNHPGMKPNDKRKLRVMIAKSPQDLAKVAKSIKEDTDTLSYIDYNVKTIAEEFILSEAVKLDRYKKANRGKSPNPRQSTMYAFTTKSSGDPKDNEMTIIDKPMKLADAGKQAMQKLRSKTVYVMEAEEVKPHMMYDPKTGKGVLAKDKADHERLGKKGYVHDKPEIKEKFANAAQQAAVMAKLKKDGKYKKEAYNEPQGQAKSMMSPLQKARLDKEKADRDRQGKLKPAAVRSEGKEGGLWDNIHKKRARIKKGSGEKMRTPGSKGAPTAQDFKDASEGTIPDGDTAMTTRGPKLTKGDSDKLNMVQKMMAREKEKRQRELAKKSREKGEYGKAKAHDDLARKDANESADDAVRRHSAALQNAQAAKKAATTDTQMVKAMNAIDFHQKALRKAMHSESTVIDRVIESALRKRFGGVVIPKKFDVYKKFVKKNKIDEPTVRMIIDNPKDNESKRMMRDKNIAQAVSLRKASIKETKGAPKGYHFTRSGQLKKGDANQDGDGGKMLRSDPLDKQRKKIPPLPENDK